MTTAPLPTTIEEIQAEEAAQAARLGITETTAKSEPPAQQGHILFQTSPEESSALRFKWQPNPLPFVFDNFGIPGTAVLIAGAGGVGKTWLEKILAAMLRTGQPLLGDDLRPMMTGNTVLCLPEDPELVKHHRLYALSDALSVDKESLLSGIFTPDLEGESLCLMVKGAKGEFVKTTAFDALADYIKRCPGVTLLENSGEYLSCSGTSKTPFKRR